jgi:hypothetical protein
MGMVAGRISVFVREDVAPTGLMILMFFNYKYVAPTALQSQAAIK